MQSTSSSARCTLLAPQDRRNRAGQMLPLLLVCRGCLLALGGQRVIFAFPAAFARSPHRRDLSLFLQLMQRGVKRALFKFESTGATARGFLKNFVPVHFAARQQIE